MSHRMHRTIPSLARARCRVALGTHLLCLLVATLATLGASRSSAAAAGADWQARHGLSAAQDQAEFEALIAQSYRLVHASGSAPGGREQFAGIWERSPGPVFASRHGIDASTYKPGTRYEYSNFGDLVLGRVIEKVTDLSYETYVANEILSAMQIAGDGLAERAPNEAVYGDAADDAY